MKDNLVEDFINKILMTDFDNKRLELYIDVFSKFIGYTNDSYKYNIPYLNQYVEDFKDFRNKIIEKNKKYNEIVAYLNASDIKDYEVFIDNMYHIKRYKSKLEKEYFNVDKKYLMDAQIFLKIILKINSEECTFSKICLNIKDIDNLITEIKNKESRGKENVSV